MSSVLTFKVEEIYYGHVRVGQVVLSGEEMGRLLRYLRASEGETSLYTSELETVCPDIYRKIDEAALPLMAEMDAMMADAGAVNLPEMPAEAEIMDASIVRDAQHPYGHYRVDIDLPAAFRP